MQRLLDSWWAVAGVFAAAAGIAAVGVWESHLYWRSRPGKPAVRLPDGNWPRLGPPTELCARNRHYRCDGIVKVGGTLIVQCGCTCHKQD